MISGVFHSKRKSHVLNVIMKSKKTISLIILCSGGLLFLGLFLIPAPISGYWHTPLTDCLCDSENLVRFENGKSYFWATAHPKDAGVNGTYEKKDGYYTWTLGGKGKDEIKFKPGWLLIWVTSKDGLLEGYGWSELRPWYIHRVLEDGKNKKS